MKQTAFAFIALAVSVGTLAQAPPEINPDRSEFEMVLLPVFFGEQVVAGAFGSRWKTELIAFNGGDVEIGMYPVGVTCPFTCPAPQVFEIQPRMAIRQPNTNGGGNGLGPGSLVYLRRGASDRLGLSLRARDLSRQEETYGTEVPVVREAELRAGVLPLFLAPRRDRFRQMLRIYQVDSVEPIPFRVRAFDQMGNELGTIFVSATGVPNGFSSGFPSNPGYAEISGIETMFRATADDAGHSIMIEPLRPDIRFWAFVSVTHDITQHTTLITPQ